jgi:hypothetical protein
LKKEWLRHPVRSRKLIKKARALYLLAISRPGDYDCGEHLYDQLRPERVVARRKFREIWAELKKLEPDAPELPKEMME